MLRVMKFFAPSRPSVTPRSFSSRNAATSSSHSSAQAGGVSASRHNVATKPSDSANRHNNERDLQNMSKEELLKKFPKEIDAAQLEKTLAEGEQMKRTFSSY